MRTLIFFLLICGPYPEAWSIQKAGAPAQPKTEPEIQITTSPYSPPNTYALKVETRLVETDVVVRDRENRSIDGLKREDFNLYDAGKIQRISEFSALIKGRPVDARPSVPAIPDRAPAEILQTTSGAPAVEATSRFVALLFDDINISGDKMEFGELSLSLQAAAQFIKERIPNGDLIGIFSLSGGPLTPFTNNAATLIAALEKVTMHPRISQPMPNWTLCSYMIPYEAYSILHFKGADLSLGCRVPAPSKEPAGGKYNTPARNPSPGDLLEQKARVIWDEVRLASIASLGMIEDLVDLMTKLPGKSSVLLASAGFLTGPEISAEQEAVIQRALRTGVVINALNVKGLYAGAPEATEVYLGRVNALGIRRLEAAEQVLLRLTDATGGSYFHGNNDLGRGFHELADPPEFSYVLAFVPEALGDGRFHKIKVEVKNRKQVSVEARPGYFAPSASDQKPKPPRKIDEAVLAHQLVSEIPVSTAILQETTGTKRLAIDFALHVAVADLHYRKEGGRNVQGVRFIAALFDQNDNIIAGKEGTIDLSLTSERLESLQDGINFTLSLFAQTGAYRLRTVVEEAGTGRLTSSDHSVEVR